MATNPNQTPGATGYPPYGPEGDAYGGPGVGPATGGAYTPTPPMPAPSDINGLIHKWINVTTKPGVATFANELPTANWRDVWISVIALAVLTVITGALGALYMPATLGVPGLNLMALPAAANWGNLIAVPLGFFFVVGILFVIARLFGGTGTFLEQAYATALYYVPLEGAAAVIGLIPGIGGFVGFLLGIYGIVLAVFSVAASQRLSVGKSVAVVLLPAAVLLVLGFILAFIIATIFVAALNGMG